MKFRLLFVAVAFLLCVAVLNAQTFRGSIQGTVTDPTGAAIAGATVTITNPATGLTRTAQTSAQGDYFFPELPLGDYNLTVSQPGFRTETQTGIHVIVTTPVHLDVKLQPGEVQQKVEVTAEVPLVEVTSDTMGGTIQEKQISELPINGRDFIKLMVLVPGSTADPSGVSDSPGAFGQFSINGNRGRSNNFLLDGTDMNDGYRNDSAINEAGVFGTPATLVPIEAVAEVAILNSTEPEYGRNSGATVNIVTKSGTNTWHGSVFWQFRNNWLDARNFFNFKPSPQDEFRNNQFGGSIGGPIFKDKTFFYLAYEGQREIIGIPENLTVPSQAQIASELVTMGGLGIPESPVIANLLALNPWGPLPATGNLSGPTGPASQQVSNKSTNFLHSLIFKADQHIGQGDVLTARYFYGTSQQSFPLALVGGGITPGFNTNTPTDVHVLSISYTHVFNPRFLMELRGGWNSFDEDFFPQDGHFDPASIGLSTGAGPQDFGLPLMSVSGYATLGATTSVPRGRVDRNWHFLDNFSWIGGRHNVKFGAEFRRTTVTQFFDSGYRGKLVFDGSSNILGDPLIDFLAGFTDGGRAAQGNSLRSTHQNSFALYGQDTFHVSRNVTLTYGLRWEYFGVIGEDHGQFSIFDPTIPGPKLVSQLYPKDFNNFAPRVAAAWDVRGNSKTVVRAGWGLFYDAFSQDFFIGQLPFNTFNPGPAYNGVGPNPITFNFSPQPVVGVPGPCAPPNIPIPNSGGQCAPPVFNQVDFSAADIFTVDQRIRTPYVQNYNLNIEQQIGGHTALTVGYVGSSGRKLFRYRDINQCFVVTPGTGGTCFPDTGTNLELNSQFGAAGLEYINQFESSSSSSYNSLQVSFQVRNWHGLNSTVNYTWGHSIDNASDGQDFVAQATQPDNSFVPKAERANSNFDTRNRFNWNFLYEFPKSENMKWLLSGWAMNGVLTLMNGQPYNLTYQFEGDYNGSGEFFGRPDLIPGANPFAGTGGLNLLNLAAFAAPCTWNDTIGACVAGSEHFGNVGRNAFRGPSFKNFDFSLVKNTDLGERVKMQIRADFFNIFNHPNFTNPSLPAFAVDFLGNGAFPTVPGCTACLLTGGGFLQPTATPDVGIGNPFLGGGGPRNIQLGLRFSF